MNTDQAALLTKNITRVRQWSDQSIIEGLKCKFSCGSTAYEIERKKRLLPSGRTLRERLQNIHFESGILDEIFSLLSHKVPTMEDADKNCVLIFDEMAIQPGVNYCNNLKKFVGSITLPGHSGVANHIMVFMLAGLKSRWKQVVAYYYTGDTVNNGCLKSIMLDIIQRAESTGLRVHVSLSDCGGRI